MIFGWVGGPAFRNYANKLLFGQTRLDFNNVCIILGIRGVGGRRYLSFCCVAISARGPEALSQKWKDCKQNGTSSPSHPPLCSPWDP